MVLLANKCDLPGALAAEGFTAEIEKCHKSALVARQHAVHECSALTGANVVQVFSWLLWHGPKKERKGDP